tara:strand:- start:54 stop:275 length:222 start_codon:yes stop_codon:yes gene_type:complete
MNFLKRLWIKLWSKTEVDDKIIAAAKEGKARVKRMGEELSDVGDSLKEVANQAGDVVDAAKGKKRRGRPRKNK